jgi:hypothetical protein
MGVNWQTEVETSIIGNCADILTDHLLSTEYGVLCRL